MEIEFGNVHQHYMAVAELQMSNLLTINEGKVNRGRGLRWLQHCTCQKSLNAIEKRDYNVGS